MQLDMATSTKLRQKVVLMRWMRCCVAGAGRRARLTRRWPTIRTKKREEKAAAAAKAAAEAKEEQAAKSEDGGPDSFAKEAFDASPWCELFEESFDAGGMRAAVPEDEDEFKELAKRFP